MKCRQFCRMETFSLDCAGLDWTDCEDESLQGNKKAASPVKLDNISITPCSIK